MTLQLSSDTGPAAWLLGSGTPDEQLTLFGPDVFSSWARLRFIPDPVRPAQSEAGVQLPDDHRSDLDQACQALGVLSSFTATPGDCWFCLWEGYSDSPLPSGLDDSALVTLPHRRYALLRGPLEGVARWPLDAGSTASEVPPAFVWPADRSWVFASDVDPHWAGVGGSAAAIEALLAEPGLDVVPADPAQVQPAYR